MNITQADIRDWKIVRHNIYCWIVYPLTFIRGSSAGSLEHFDLTTGKIQTEAVVGAKDKAIKQF